jgi:beta-glucosidase/6-phospho-beta-glucosidase/beta-galactosidase
MTLGSELPPALLFSSFWMGGFESACQINSNRERVDMIAGVQHDTQVSDDYRRLAEFNIRTVRDGVRWHLIDRGGPEYDFSSFLPMLDAALETGTQVIWNLCHYGWPDDVDVFSAEFVERFRRFAKATARIVRERSDGVPFYAPINEMSFFAWAAGRDIIYPFAHGKDNEIKFQLIRAALAATDAIWEVDPRARIVYPEPVVNVIAPRANPEAACAALQQTESQYEAWDTIAGKMRPELGGSTHFLDVIGVNFYHSNQWEYGNGRLRWEDEPRDERWIPFHRILGRVWDRYKRPIFISETSHFGAGRARWIREIGQEVFEARRAGIPVEGVCLYPILDRYDWEDRTHWHNSGLWDLHPVNGHLDRVLNTEYATALRESQLLLSTVGCR